MARFINVETCKGHIIIVVLLTLCHANLGALPNATIEPGTQVETASYVIWNEGLTYYAKNVRIGAIDYSGTNASQVINNAISSLDLNVGGTITLLSGAYNIDASIDLCKHHLRITGEQQGSTILNWTGITGGYVIVTDSLKPAYDSEIENLEIQTHDKAHAIYLKSVLRFTIRDILIAGGTSSNQYSGITLEATNGNVGWGEIDNVFMDYVDNGINFYGHNSSNVVTLINVGTIFADHVRSYGLRFIQWCDSIDVDYAWFVSNRDNVSGAIFNDGANPNQDNGVYNIHIRRLVFDNWHYNNTRTVIVNNVKELKIDSAYMGNSSDTFGTFNPNAVSYWIVQQGAWKNMIKVWRKNVDFDSGKWTGVNNGDWVEHNVGWEPTTIVSTLARILCFTILIISLDMWACRRKTCARGFFFQSYSHRRPRSSMSGFPMIFLS